MDHTFNSVKVIEYRWDLKHSSPTASSFQELKAIALKFQRQIFLAQNAGHLFQRLIPPEQTASYILVETRPFARLRARIHLNRPSFNVPLFIRHLAPSRTCPYCASDEDVEHVLLECHAYALARHQLVNSLWSLAVNDNKAGWSMFKSL